MAMAKVGILGDAAALSANVALEEQLQVVEEILAYLKKNKSVGKGAVLREGGGKGFIGERGGASGEPKSAAHFLALRAHIQLAIMRRDLEGRWDRQMVPQGTPAWAALSRESLESAAQLAKEIQRCLAWHAAEWQPVENGLRESGFLWREFFGEQRGEGHLQRLREMVGVQLPQAFPGRKDMVRFGEVDAQLQALRSALALPRDVPPSQVLAKLSRAAERLDARDSREAHQRLAALDGQRMTAAGRRELLAALHAWAAGVVRAV